MIVKLTNRARKDIRKLSPENKERVRKGILTLAEDPRRGIPLAGMWEGYHRLRIGNYRIIYRVYENEIIVHYVRARSEAYRHG
jgi:mRNA interferase RelE/StbE